MMGYFNRHVELSIYNKYKSEGRLTAGESESPYVLRRRQKGKGKHLSQTSWKYFTEMGFCSYWNFTKPIRGGSNHLVQRWSDFSRKGAARKDFGVT